MQKQIIIYLFFILLVSTISCQTSSGSPFCKEYMRKACNICGEPTQACSVIKKKFNKCLLEGNCQEDICQTSLLEMKRTSTEDLKKMICGGVTP